MKSYNFCSTVDDVDDDDVERVWTFCLLMFFWTDILTHVENVIFLISQKGNFGLSEYLRCIVCLFTLSMIRIILKWLKHRVGLGLCLDIFKDARPLQVVSKLFLLNSNGRLELFRRACYCTVVTDSAGNSASVHTFYGSCGLGLPTPNRWITRHDIFSSIISFLLWPNFRPKGDILAS